MCCTNEMEKKGTEGEAHREGNELVPAGERRGGLGRRTTTVLMLLKADSSVVKGLTAEACT
jgi:hypothetical protein